MILKGEGHKNSDFSSTVKSCRREGERETSKVIFLGLCFWRRKAVNIGQYGTAVMRIIKIWTHINWLADYQTRHCVYYVRGFLSKEKKTLISSDCRFMICHTIPRLLYYGNGFLIASSLLGRGRLRMKYELRTPPDKQAITPMATGGGAIPQIWESLWCLRQKSWAEKQHFNSDPY